MERDMETVVHDGWNTAVDRYIGTGDICRTGNRMTDENGRALTKEETEQLLEEWFYTEEKDREPQHEIVYRSLLAEWLEKR